MHEIRKKVAVNLLLGIVTENAEHVYHASTTPTFFHHNVFFKGDKQSMLEALIENNVLFPNKKITIRHVLAEGDLVTVFSEVNLTEDVSYATIHLFRFEGDLIAEMWDFAQEIPKTSVNLHGIF